MAEMGGDPTAINPLQPVELVIDHSVQVDYFGSDAALAKNADLEFERNRERYAFLKWGQSALRGFRAVPPDTGIVHQVNIEYLARVVFGVATRCVARRPRRLSRHRGRHRFAHDDGQRARRARVGRRRYRSRSRDARSAGDDAHSRSRRRPARRRVARGRHGDRSRADDHARCCARRASSESSSSSSASGLSALPVADRTTIGNMSPEFGSTVAIFPIDDRTLEYLRLTGRAPAHIALVEAYAKAQGLFRTDATPDPEFTDGATPRSLDRRTEPRRAAPSAGPRRARRRQAHVRRCDGRVDRAAQRCKQCDRALSGRRRRRNRDDRADGDRRLATARSSLRRSRAARTRRIRRCSSAPDCSRATRFGAD